MNDNVYISRPAPGCNLWIARNRNTRMILAAEYTLVELVTTLGWLDGDECDEQAEQRLADQGDQFTHVPKKTWPDYQTVTWNDESASIGHDGASLGGAS